MLFDRPAVVDPAGGRLSTSPVAERIELVGGDFFAAVPAGGDVYVLATVLHDWDDERAVQILRRLRTAMPPAATLLIAEQVLPEGAEPFFGKLLDIEMLVLAGGRERTAGEYETLLRETGLRTARVIPTPSPTSLIEARVA